MILKNTNKQIHYIMERIHSLGQYFTTNIKLKEKVYEFIKNNPDEILEPSVGRCDLVDFIIRKGDKIKFK